MVQHLKNQVLLSSLSGLAKILKKIKGPNVQDPVQRPKSIMFEWMSGVEPQSPLFKSFSPPSSPITLTSIVIKCEAFFFCQISRFFVLLSANFKVCVSFYHLFFCFDFQKVGFMQEDVCIVIKCELGLSFVYGSYVRKRMLVVSQIRFRLFQGLSFLNFCVIS